LVRPAVLDHMNDNLVCGKAREKFLIENSNRLVCRLTEEPVELGLPDYQGQGKQRNQSLHIDLFIKHTDEAMRLCFIEHQSGSEGPQPC
jgi:hypothetical protein